MALTGGSNGPRRSHQACLNCRRKKVRCPGEKPACSSCTRLKQNCHYGSSTKTSSSSKPVEARLAQLEQQLSFILTESRHETPKKIATEFLTADHIRTGGNTDSIHISEDTEDELENVLRIPNRRTSFTSSHIPSAKTIEKALELYFQYCHRQPIWCLSPGDSESFKPFSDDFVYALLFLTSHFAEDHDHSSRYVERAKHAVMLQIAEGTASLSTIESSCMLAYSNFLDGSFAIGQFYLGLAAQLCESALLDVESTYEVENDLSERKKRIYWSCQNLYHFYGRQAGLLNTLCDIWRPSNQSLADTEPLHHSQTSTSGLLPLPETTDTTTDIWSISLDLVSMWSRVRTYVADAAHHLLKEPWHHDSKYAMILSDLMDRENRIPMSHRYQSLKFYQREPEDLNNYLDYWKPWLKSQFTYHACHMTLNHPFLYVVASQKNSNLAIPNTFWRRATELVLSHATWIARMIDMVVDKSIQLSDPFFAHAAAIAATVHLYYCCAVDTRLKAKSRLDLIKCKSFLEHFASMFTSCQILEARLNKLIQVAAGTDDVDLNTWAPLKIHLHSQLMWNILEFTSNVASTENSLQGLLHPSLHPPLNQASDQGSTYEIVVSTSPEITVNISDGGQAAPLTSTAEVDETMDAVEATTQHELLLAPSESLRINPLWLWPDQSQDMVVGENGMYDLFDPNIGDAGGLHFWDFSNL